MNDIVRSIHALAALRHCFGDDDSKLMVVIAPYDAPAAAPGPPEPELGWRCPKWAAQIYLGDGDWGNIAGAGDSPEDALRNLHQGLLDAHRAVNARRAAAQARAETTLPDWRWCRACNAIIPIDYSLEHQRDGSHARITLGGETTWLEPTHTRPGFGTRKDLASGGSDPEITIEYDGRPLKR